MVALGHTSAGIAEQLSLSAKTVETYCTRGMAYARNAGKVCIAGRFNSRGMNKWLIVNNIQSAHLAEVLQYRPKIMHSTMSSHLK